ncbi:MAG TPA: terminase family protein [Stellaceae bacterium]|nr:terminase family protein [Stellaceae bacterium]
MSRKDEILTILEEQVKAKRENKLKSFVPYPRQAEFIAATHDHTEVALRAGNQQGKSETAAYFVAVVATGLYPEGWQGRRWDKPVRIWVAGESTTAVRDVIQRKLCGPPGDDSLLGTGFIPKDTFVKTILGHGAGGAFDKVLVRHASGGLSEIRFLSYDMERSKWQGESIDLVWCDEEPPVEHYEEAIARTIATNGLIISTFTPLNGLNLILPRFNERTAIAGRLRKLIAMRMDDALHLQDPARRAALLATFPAHQRRARIDGLPLLGSGAVFEDVQQEDLMDPIRVVGDDIVHERIGALNTRGWVFLWAVDFGIDHPFAAVLLAWDRDSDTVYVLAEVKIKGGVPAIHASRMRAIAANVRVAWPHDGTQRDKGSGEQLAQIYKGEGLQMLPTHATHPTGGYSLEAGIADLLVRMKSGRFKVASHLTEWLDEFAGYHRKDGLIVKVNDDLLSATRIGVMQIRSATNVALGSRIVQRRRSERAKGVDDNPLDW